VTRYRLLLPRLLALTILWGIISPSHAQTAPPQTSPLLEPVVLQLKWQHQFQFAGYYMAVAKGYYQSAGLDVKIIPATPGSDPAQAVIDGTADFGIGTSELLLMRAKGAPVVALAPIFQHSPFVLLTLSGRNLDTLDSLVGKTLMAEEQAAELWAYMVNEGIPLNRINRVPHAFTVAPLLSGEVAAMTAYVSDEPYDLRKLGIPFTLLTPRSGGIDFYGDTLFTTEQQISQHPQRVKAFIEASLRGWRDALDNPDAAIDLIEAHYPSIKDRDHLRYEAEQLRRLIMPEIIEIGHNNPGRWQHILNSYRSLGLIPADQDVDLSAFLYTPSRNTPLPAWVNWTALSAAAVILMLVVLLMRTTSLARQIREREQRLRLLTDTMIDVVWSADASLVYTYCSPSVEKLTGRQAHALLGHSVFGNLPPSSRTRAEQAIARARMQAQTTVQRTGAPTTEDVWLELEAHTLYGATVQTEVSARLTFDANGTLQGMHGITRDISERHALRLELEKLATTDPLTSAANRRAFAEALEREINCSVRSGQPVTLILLDLDHFKQVNDHWGHPAGDVVLCAIARQLQNAVRSVDMVARLGGEEFAILLENTPLKDANELAERLRQGIIATPILLETGETLHISASFGVAQHSPCETGNNLYARADHALYHAKSSGRNCVCHA